MYRKETIDSSDVRPCMIGEILTGHVPIKCSVRDSIGGSIEVLVPVSHPPSIHPTIPQAHTGTL